MNHVDAGRGCLGEDDRRVDRGFRLRASVGGEEDVADTGSFHVSSLPGDTGP